MKSLPWICTAAVIGAGCFFGWRNSKQLEEIRTENERLVAALPESQRPSTHPRGRVRSPSRDAKEADAVRLARELDAAKAGGGTAGERLEHSSAQWLKNLSSLPEEEITRQLAALQDDAAVSPETRRNLVGFALLELAKERPETALRLTGSLAAGRNPLLGHAETAALGNLAKTNSAAALEWLRSKQERDPTWDASEARRALISGLAAQDPAAALRAFGQIGARPGDGTIEAIASARVDDPHHRSAVLQALRGYLSGLPEDQRGEAADDALSAIARHMEHKDFATTTAWLEGEKFTPEEMAAFANGMDYSQTKEETGKWIEWIGKGLPGSPASSPVHGLMADWTQQDYRAAGQWLAQAPAGRAKEEAVGAYAATVAEYDPQVAVQWAMTLPPDRRTDTFQAIYQNWPAADPAGAEAFARQHGISTEDQLDGDSNVVR